MTEKNSSRSTQKSALAFQIADGAAENILKRIYKDTDPTLDSLATALTPVQGGNRDGQTLDVPTSQIPQCVNGAISVASMPELEVGKYSVSFFDANSNPLECSGPGFSTNAEWRTKVARIVSVGTYNGVTRAIDTTIRPAGCGGITTVDDADNNTYDTVEIGTQCWMKQNMRVGTSINTSQSQDDDGNTEYYCYDNDQNNCDNNHPNYPDGGLYTWDEAMQYSTTEGTQGICPDGWHIPTEANWQTLESYLSDPPEPCDGDRIGGGSCKNAGTKLLVGESSGFEANLSGWGGSGTSFTGYDIGAFYWSSTNAVTRGQIRYLFPAGGLVGFVIKSAFSGGGVALTVRCIKN